jgi:hypothetical protein
LALAASACAAAAGGEATTPPLELAVAGDKVELHGEPSVESAVIKVLPAGTRLEAVEPFDDAAEGRAERWLHVRAGDATGWVRYVNVVPAPLYDYLGRVYKLSVLSQWVKDGTPGWRPEEKVVCPPTLELRAEPAPDAKVVAVVTSGETVAVDQGWGTGDGADDGPHWYGRYWAPARAGGSFGWADIDYMVPPVLYDAYREADRLGKAGDAAGMVAAARAAWPTSVKTMNISPDGRKLVVWALGPEDSYISCPVYFEAGKGLAQKGAPDNEGIWSPDSRYFAFVDRSFYTADIGDFYLFDTTKPGYAHLGATWKHDFTDAAEYVDGYVVWLNFRYVPGPWGPDEPELAAYEVATGKTTVLLRADDTTLRRTQDETEEVKLLPAGPRPRVLKGSRLYNKFNGAYVARGDYGARAKWR